MARRDDDEAGDGRRVLADFGVAFGAMVVLVVLLVGVIAWVGVRAWIDQVPAAAGDLSRFDEIDLYELAGANADIGVTRSNLVPMVVHRSEQEASSLAVVDADAGVVLDGGPIPVHGWIGDGYWRASDRYAAAIVNVCSGKPTEGDAGLECGGDDRSMPVGVQLSVYDIEAQRWATLPLDAESNQDLILEDVDGSTATIQQYPGSPDEVPMWTTVHLAQPLRLSEFSASKPKGRPNGLATSQGHLDGFGWKASDVDGGERNATWVGSLDGREQTVEISTVPLRHLYGAGRCLVIASVRANHLDHLHRLCADT